MDQYIGKMLDNRYEILERIGTGGMAIVYKAKCHRLNRLVAIKILKSDLAQNEEFRRRFNAESQAVAQLSHPNIVSVYDVSRGGDMEYIVMDKDHPLLPIFIGYCTDLIPPPPLIEFSLVLGSLP